MAQAQGSRRKLYSVNHTDDGSVFAPREGPFEKEPLIAIQNSGQQISQEQYDGCPHWVKKDDFDL